MNDSIRKKLDPRQFGLTAGQLFAAARCFYPDADPRRHRLLDSPLSAAHHGLIRSRLQALAYALLVEDEIAASVADRERAVCDRDER